jgi:hypothetical protein
MRLTDVHGSVIGEVVGLSKVGPAYPVH